MTIKDKKKVICILTPEFSSSSVHFKNSDIWKWNFYFLISIDFLMTSSYNFNL